jgi:DNA-binding MltR family transcriptional regulator
MAKKEKRQARLPELLSAESKHLFDVLSGDLPAIAVVLVGVTFLEQGLMSLLKQRLVNGETSKRLFHLGGMLGEFSRCHDLAYCLGLIPLSDYQSLLLIGDIRNDFAHTPKLLRFMDEEISEKCNRLTLPKPMDEFAVNARDRFRLAVVYLWGRLVTIAMATNHIEPCEEPNVVTG